MNTGDERSLKEVQAELALARAARERVERDWPSLELAVKDAVARIDEAMLQAIPRVGDPAAEALVTTARAARAVALARRDEAEEQIEFLTRTEARLQKELAELNAEGLAEQRARATEQLRAKLTDLAPQVAEAIKVGSALTKLAGRLTWTCESLYQDLGKGLGLDVDALITQGHYLASRVRAGKEVV